MADFLHPSPPPAADGSPGRKAGCLLVGLILLFESCALAATVLMLWLLLRYVLGKDSPAQPWTSQAARMLQYWATLLYVHAIALAWSRRASSARSALCGFAGILYLGCGYVFSLTLGGLAEFRQWPEEVQTVFWSVVLPIVAWSSALLGSFLLLQSLTARPSAATRFAAAGDASPNARPRLRCPALVPLVLVTLFPTTLVTAAVVFRTGSLVATWFFRSVPDRSADFLGVLLYALVYLFASLAALGAALVFGRRALKTNEPDLLWRAGVLAAVGGLQHVLLFGLPALLGGIFATRAAGRSASPKPIALADVLRPRRTP